MHKFISPINIIFGEGTIQQLAAECNQFGAKNIVLFADKGVVAAGLAAKVEAVLKTAGIPYTLYDDIVPEPPVQKANEAVDYVRRQDADLVIAVGGGSAMDMAKAAAVLATHEGSVADYLNLTGSKKLQNKGLPKILIPTTAGTGSEVTDIAVFALTTTKDVITHPFLLADVAIVDPELTYSVPARITAATGVDAFTHAIESFTSIQSSLLTDTLALEAIRLISANLRKAVWQGHDKEARKNMAWGSLIAGLSFFNAGCAGVHALAYPLGGLFHMPHGESNAVMLPYVYEYILPACVEKMEKVAFAMGVGRKNASTRQNAFAALQAVKDLVADVGIPSNLRPFGVTEDDVERLSADGIGQKRLLARSPKAFRLDDVREVYRKAIIG